MCDFVFMLMFVFFKQKTAYELRMSDWSSDVCSSDLGFADAVGESGRRDALTLRVADLHAQRTGRDKAAGIERDPKMAKIRRRLVRRSDHQFGRAGRQRDRKSVV